MCIIWVASWPCVTSSGQTLRNVDEAQSNLLSDLSFSNFSWTHPCTRFQVNSTGNHMKERETFAFPQEFFALVDDFLPNFELRCCHSIKHTGDQLWQDDAPSLLLQRPCCLLFYIHLHYICINTNVVSNPSPTPKKTYFSSKNKWVCQKIEGMIVVFCLSWSFIVHYIVNIVHAHHHGSVALWGLLGEWCAHRIFMGYCRKEYHGCIKSTTMMRW